MNSEEKVDICKSCGKTIGPSERAIIVNGGLICFQCEQKQKERSSFHSSSIQANKVKMELYDCQHCHTKGVLPMDDMSCPNCKQKLSIENRKFPISYNAALQNIGETNRSMGEPTTDSIDGQSELKTGDLISDNIRPEVSHDKVVVTDAKEERLCAEKKREKKVMSMSMLFFVMAIGWVIVMIPIHLYLDSTTGGYDLVVSAHNIERVNGNFIWRFFEWGMIVGDKPTAFKWFLIDKFYIEYDNAACFDITNPTPFMIFIILLIFSFLSFIFKEIAEDMRQSQQARAACYNKFIKGFEKLKIGATVDEMLSLIGKPTKQQKDGDVREKWIYETAKKGGLSSTIYLNTVIIADNKVIEIIPDSDWEEAKQS